MPYQTPGSIMLAMEYHRGILFTGDAAIAPGPLQAPEPPRLERPSVPPQKDDDFRKDWEVICAQRHFSSVLPRHGTPYTDRVDMHQIMRKLWDSAPMTPGEPAAAGQRVRAAGVDG
jgi:glyoxylase-like metal-dependent hydrolase (beta-lactamase superfamily II)